MQTHRLRELDSVRTARPLFVEDSYNASRGTQHIPSGTAGVVLAVLGDGDAYDVEFCLREAAYDAAGALQTPPVEMVATLRADDLMSARG